MGKQKAVYFIRHKNFSSEVFESLKNKKLIAIDFGMSIDASFENIEYESNAHKTAVRYFLDLNEKGGLVVAHYGNDQYVTVGDISRGTQIEPFMHFRMSLEYTPKKTLHFADYPVLSTVWPQQGTMCIPRTPFFQEIVPAIIGNKPLKLERRLLHTKMLEQLCVEYLYKADLGDDKLDYCILRPGKTAPVIDIAGVTCGGKKLYAQVKANKIGSVARNNFEEFVSESSLNIIFSADLSDETIFSGKKITCVNVDEVFNHFHENKPQMLKDMIGINHDFLKS